MCALPQKYREILEMVLKSMKICEINYIKLSEYYIKLSETLRCRLRNYYYYLSLFYFYCGAGCEVPRKEHHPDTAAVQPGGTYTLITDATNPPLPPGAQDALSRMLYVNSHCTL